MEPKEHPKARYTPYEALALYANPQNWRLGAGVWEWCGLDDNDDPWEAAQKGLNALADGIKYLQGKQGAVILVTEVMDFRRYARE